MRRAAKVKAALTAALFSCVCLLTVWMGVSGMDKASAATQIHNDHFTSLPLPTEDEYVYKDWKQTTMDYLEFIFNEANIYDADNGDNGGYMPAHRTRKIGRFVSAPNIDDYFGESGNVAWGVPSYIGDNLNDLELGEGVAVVSALASAALVGVPELNNYELADGTRFNFVKSAVAYYSADEHVILNSDTGASGGSFWYQLLPQVCFSILAAEYGDEEPYLNDIVTESSRQLLRAVIGMGGVNADFNWLGYSLTLDEPVAGNWREPDAAAGIAYVLYSAYSLNTLLLEAGEPAYATESEIEQFRLGAIWCMNFLERIDYSPFYEVLTFLAPYLAARMNAEQGTSYNVAKMIGWTVNGNSAVRSGWGMIGENWGDAYTAGLMGSTTDTGGYAFAMNTFDAVLGFVPLVRYDNRFAEDIARWMLCVTQSAQMFFPEKSPFTGGYRDTPAGQVYNGDYQSGVWIDADDSNIGGSKVSSGNVRASFIPYEGLRRYRKAVTYNSASSSSRTTVTDDYSPYASGDGYTYNWNRHTDYGLYGAGHMGFLGAVVSETNVSRILEIDVSKLDIYNFSDGIGFRMYYNPYETAQEITVTAAAGSRLWDTMTKAYVGTSEDGTVSVEIPAGATMVLAEIPAGSQVSVVNGAYTCDGVFLTEERGSVSVAVYGSAEGGTAVAGGAEVSGTVYAEIGAVPPENGKVTEVTLLFSDTELYSGGMPSGRIPVDTTLLRNGSGTMTAVVTFDNGKSERAQCSVRVLNADTTPAVSYEDDADWAATWQDATDAWQTQHPESDHDAAITTAAGGGITISNMSARSYAWASSELFYVDFSRAPYLELSIGAVSAQYSLKIYIEGDPDSAADKYTGRYLINDTASVGPVTAIDLAEAVRATGLDITGTALVSFKISTANGNTGDFVTVESFSVYHTYATPAPEEPAEYEWGFTFSAPYLSLWSVAEGSPQSSYNEAGEMVITSDGVRGGVSGPYVAAAVNQSPIIEVSPLRLTGAYYVGVLIEGYDGIYVLADNVTSTARREISVVSEMAARYDMTLSQNVNISIVVGAEADGSVTFGTVDTYYKLPEWGTTVEGDAFSSWERQPSLGARASISFDAGGRAVITNTAVSGNETVSGGRRGAMTVNFDYNPELDIVVRAATGDWRLTMTLFDGGSYTLVDWTDSYGREPIGVSLKEIAGDLRGSYSVYLNIEVRGGGNSVTVQYIETRYRQTVPVFGAGYAAEDAATWVAENAGVVSVTDGRLHIEATSAQNGLLTPAMAVAGGRNPVVRIGLASLSSAAQLDVTLYIGDTTYAFDPVTAAGDTVLDIRALTGFSADRAFTVRVGIVPHNTSGIGTAACVIGDIGFLYALDAPSGVHMDTENNVMLWNAVPYAREYEYEVYDADGLLARKGSAGVARLDISKLALPEGVYYMDLRAAADGCETSVSTRAAFKQGDIESITLARPTVTIDGVTAQWTECTGAASYALTLTDKDSGETLYSGNTTATSVDVTTLGLSAFNYTLTVQAKGDGAAYLDGEAAAFDFYTDIAGRFQPQTFAAMTPGQNNAYAEVDESGAAVIRVPNNGEWGNIVSLAFNLDFDRNPVLRVQFGEDNVGGYHMSINIDGVSYHLCDDTYTFGDGDVFFDINEILATRDDGPGRQTGVKSVQIVFGVTSVLMGGTPSVQIRNAYVYQLTEGSGTAQLGQLATPSVTVSADDKTVSWNAVEHAERYVVIISNEFGPLLTEEVEGTSYSFAMLEAAGEYSVSVTATAERYFNSESAAATFTLDGREGQPSGGLPAGAIAGIVIAAVVAAAGIGVLIWWFTARRKKGASDK